MLAAVITVLVVALTALIEYCFSFLRILVKKPLLPTSAVEIDANEHIYAHPECTQGLRETESFGVKTLHDVLLHGVKLAGDRPLFSFREASNQPFKSYTHK